MPAPSLKPCAQGSGEAVLSRQRCLATRTAEGDQSHLEKKSHRSSVLPRFKDMAEMG